MAFDIIKNTVKVLELNSFQLKPMDSFSYVLKIKWNSDFWTQFPLNADNFQKSPLPRSHPCLKFLFALIAARQ